MKAVVGNKVSDVNTVGIAELKAVSLRGTASDVTWTNHSSKCQQVPQNLFLASVGLLEKILQETLEQKIQSVVNKIHIEQQLQCDLPHPFPASSLNPALFSLSLSFLVFSHSCFKPCCVWHSCLSQVGPGGSSCLAPGVRR